MIRHKANSFTLVEMIGAMAILAILASVLAPSVVRQIQTATAVGEDTKLEDIAQALTSGIRATGLIPNPNLFPTNTNAADGYGWAYLASNYTRLSGSNLVSVFPGLTNETFRRLYLSTNLVGTASNGGFANTMTNWGAVMFPTNAKMYLVSASRPEFTLALATNGAGAQTTDNSYANSAVSSLDGWVKQFSDGVTVAPANIVGSWTNRGEFLHVRTIDIASIFNETRTAQQKAIEQEDKNLDEIARALVASIQETGTIPNPAISASAGWVAQVAGYSSMGANAIQYSFPANRIGERRLYLDLSLNLYVGGPPPGGWNVLPVVPASAYLVSVSKEDDTILNLNTANGGAQALGAADLTFLRTWQKVPDSSGIYIANNANIVSAAWANRGEFLHVRSIDLRSLFCRVELIDTACPPTATISNGTGYAVGDVITFNVGSYPFSFTATGTSFGGQAGNLAANPPQMLTKPFSSSTTTDPRSGSRISGSSSGIDAIATLSSTPSPQFQLNNLAAQPFGAGNTMVFYLLKGTSLSLLNNAGVILNTFTVQGDSIFKYFNSTWSKVD
jgi:type II secretory pathway pseudopilin PulG